MTQPPSEEDHRPTVPIWPLWLAGSLDIASAVAYQAAAPFKSWLIESTWILTALIVMWHSRRARRLGYQAPATSPLDTWDGSGMGGGPGT